MTGRASTTDAAAERTRAALDAVQAAPTAPVPEQALAPFLDLALELVRRAAPDPALVAAAAPHVAALELALTAYVSRLEELLMSAFESDEWRWACERRSRIEAVRALWPDQLGGEGAPLVWIETVDDLLRQKGRHEGGLAAADIPAGTPTSHWWWWYPSPPP